MRAATRTLLIAILAAILITSIGGLAWFRQNQAHLLDVQTGSMAPVFQPGDGLLVRKVSVKDLKPGMIISYHSQQNPSILISHRIVSIDYAAGQLITQGDRLTQADPSIPLTAVVGRAIAVFPRLGQVLELLKTPLGLALTLYLPAATVLFLEILRMTHHLRRPLYRAVSYQTRALQ